MVINIPLIKSDINPMVNVNLMCYRCSSICELCYSNVDISLK
jgi:hypothetical protein